MATWNSTKPIEWSQDQGMEYSDNENSWTYATVSDYLTITTKVGEYSDFSNHPATKKIEHYSQNEALALLETLMDWAGRYNPREMNELIVKLKAKCENIK